MSNRYLYCCIFFMQVLIFRVLVTFGTIGHTFSLLASSFIEEEHQIWYYLTTTSVATCGIVCVYKFINATSDCNKSYNKAQGINYCQVTTPDTSSPNPEYSERPKQDTELRNRFIDVEDDSECKISDDCTNEVPKQNNHFDTGSNKNINPHVMAKKKQFYKDSRNSVGYVVVCLVLSRVLRSWNSTGDKWAHLPDVGDWLIRLYPLSWLHFIFVSVRVYSSYVAG